MIKRCFLHSGNDPKSGKLSAGMGGRFHPESVATLFRNGWQVWTGICILHRIGILTRAGLISRVHGISFTNFKDNLFKPLELIVFASHDDIIRDYVYRSRHPHIAEMVFERVLTDVHDRYDQYVRIISCLDIDYNSDRDAFKGLTNAKQLMSIFKDPSMIRKIYEIATQRFRNDPILTHQEAIFEMNSPAGNLEKATEIY